MHKTLLAVLMLLPLTILFAQGGGNTIAPRSLGTWYNFPTFAQCDPSVIDITADNIGPCELFGNQTYRQVVTNDLGPAVYIHIILECSIGSINGASAYLQLQVANVS